MKRAFVSLVALILMTLAQPVSALILRSNDFSADPLWTAFNNTTPQNNYGYSAGTANAGGTTGEIGGTTGRNAFDSYYADTALTETLTLNHELYASGRFIIQNPVTWDHGILVGHFGTSAVDDFAAMTISEPNFSFSQSRVRANIERDAGGGNTIAATPFVNVTRGVPHTFEYFWDPDGGTTGRGLLSLAIDNVILTSEDVGGAFSLAERNAASPGGPVPIGFDGWGMALGGSSIASSTVQVFLDNVVYSIPEPSAVMLLGLAGLVWARRKFATQ